MDHDLRSLVDKLNQPLRRSLESAAAQCVKQTHYHVEIEHLLRSLLDRPATDVAAILKVYDLPQEDVVAELDHTLQRLPRGNTRTPSLSPNLIRLLHESFLCSSLMLSSPVIRSGALLFTLLDHAALRATISGSCPALHRLPREKLRADLREIVRVSDEESAPPAAQGAAPGAAPAAGGAASALDQYTTDLTAQARAGLLDPIRGRDFEIRQIIDILMRRRQNNPILTGEAGVGKTAVVEGFAQRVAVEDVPPPLRKISVRVLDLALLSAGAGVKGEFEARLKGVISEVQASPRPVILFIDEAHNLIGAGGTAGQGDAANLLKPALARGDLRTIAATTWSEYKKYFEKDPALVRRFQVIRIGEPDEQAAVAMLRGVAGKLEAHHGVRILADALLDTVRLSQRYLSGSYLPDKAIRVLDTACARVAVGQTGTPAGVEDALREIDLLDVELALLERERRAGQPHEERIAQLQTRHKGAEKRHEELSARWRTELEAVTEVRTLIDELGQEKPEAQVAELTRKRAALATLQGETPMIPVCVDTHVVSGVISDWTGVPIRKMLTDEIRAVRELPERMARRVIGQPQALDAICRRVRTSRAGLTDPQKPTGVFLLCGPSGVGKTETALALAEGLYGGAGHHLVTINMSEYQEAHMVSLLKGSPPGYVGYGRGGVLTEAVRKNPYSLVLLDEVEKAHPDVVELFYQVFDKGQLEDGEGVLVDFKNTLILLTTNIGTEELFALCQGGKRPDAEDALDRLRPLLLRRFKAALLGRLAVVPYYPLRDEDITAIVRLKLSRVQKRFHDSHRAELHFSDELVAAVAARCTEVDSGARNIDAILEKTILPAVSDWILDLLLGGEKLSGMQVGCAEDGSLTYTLTAPTAASPKRKPRRKKGHE